jgi:hypothetical protein
MPKPTKKREQRNDYWVNRDDQRRNAARTFKTIVNWTAYWNDDGPDGEDDSDSDWF